MITTVPLMVCVASASTSPVVAYAVFRYTSFAVLVPSNCAEAANAADTAVPATFTVAELVNAVDGSKSTIVVANVVALAVAVPKLIAPVELAFSVDASALVVFCCKVAVTPMTRIRPCGKS